MSIQTNQLVEELKQAAILYGEVPVGKQPDHVRAKDRLAEAEMRLKAEIARLEGVIGRFIEKWELAAERVADLEARLDDSPCND